MYGSLRAFLEDLIKPACLPSKAILYTTKISEVTN
jgi:hypothetical protein